jgi:hypothetical protein
MHSLLEASISFTNSSLPRTHGREEREFDQLDNAWGLGSCICNQPDKHCASPAHVWLGSGPLEVLGDDVGCILVSMSLYSLMDWMQAGPAGWGTVNSRVRGQKHP